MAEPLPVSSATASGKRSSGRPVNRSICMRTPDASRGRQESASSATAARFLLASLMAPFLYLRVHVGWIAVCRGNSVQLRIQDITLGLESSNGLFLEIA